MWGRRHLVRSLSRNRSPFVECRDILAGNRRINRLFEAALPVHVRSQRPFIPDCIKKRLNEGIDAAHDRSHAAHAGVNHHCVAALETELA